MWILVIIITALFMYTLPSIMIVLEKTKMNITKQKIILGMCEYLNCDVNSQRHREIKEFVNNRKW